jgi:hypothetical protein
MRSFLSVTATVFALSCAFGTASAQRHDLGSAPPTAPPPKLIVGPQLIIPNLINAGLGPIQFVTANLPVSAPQSLAIQLQSSDDRMRTSGLADIGVPSQYLIRGHVPFAHSVRLDFVALGNTPELDAILTVELDKDVVSAVLMPQDDVWHRIATLSYTTPLGDPTTTTSTFVRTNRSLSENQHYSAIFQAIANGTNGDFTETEAHLRILNGHAVITVSFPATERSCDPTHQRPCDFTERWFQPDTTDPAHNFLLVTATGHVRPNESGDPIARSEAFATAHLRTFTCQPFAFSEATQHFESTAPTIPCMAPHDPQREQQHEPHEPQHEQEHEPHAPSPVPPPAPQN